MVAPMTFIPVIVPNDGFNHSVQGYGEPYYDAPVEGYVVAPQGTAPYNKD